MSRPPTGPTRPGRHGITAVELGRVMLRAEARNFYEALDTPDEEMAAKKLEIAAMKFAEAVAKDA